jgi:hypothetical protein
MYGTPRFTHRFARIVTANKFNLYYSYYIMAKPGSKGNNSSRVVVRNLIGKITTQGSGLRSKPKPRCKAYRGQGRG